MQKAFSTHIVDIVLEELDGVAVVAIAADVYGLPFTRREENPEVPEASTMISP